MLIVSRDEELIGQVGRYLGDLSLSCASASNQGEVHALLEYTSPKLALLDADMGEDEAMSICTELGERTGVDDMAILVLVSKMDDETLIALLDAGADDVVGRKLKRLSFKARVTAHLSRISTRRRLAQKVRDSELLIDATSHMVGSDDLLVNLYEVSSLIASVLDVDRCSVVLIRPERDFGLVIASSDDRHLRGQPINLARYPEIISVADQGTPLVINDVRKTTLLSKVLSSIEGAGICSMALFPIRRGVETLGVIFLRFRRMREELEQREIIFCKTVANAASIALRNAEILELLKAKTREVEKVQTEARDRVRSLKRYEEFFLTALDGMVVLEQSGKIVFANPKASNLLGKESASLEGFHFAELLMRDDREEFEKLLDEYKLGEARRSIDIRITHASGFERTLLVSAGALFGEEGLMLLTMRDVTEERAMELRLEEAQHLLVLSEKRAAMAELAGAAAHELNQPLTLLMTSVGVLQRVMDDNSDKQKILSTMEQESERMAAIIRRLTKITNYSTKQYVGDSKIIDLDSACEGGSEEKGSP